MMPTSQSAVARYLAKLPHGLASYPDCLASVDIVHEVLARYPNLARSVGLSTSVQDMLSRPVSSKGFIPEVHCMTYFMALRDTHERSDAAVVKGVVSDTEKVLDGPFVRHLWRVLSPSLMILGCQKRWSSVHTGTQLVSLESSANSSTLALTFPPFLFNDLMLTCFAAGIEQALRRTRVAKFSVTAKPMSETECHFLGSWS